jgi:hypothetical protein
MEISDKVKFYKDLLGIFFTSPDCEEDQYFHAFSFEREVLENMIKNYVCKIEQKYYSIKKIKVFQYIISKDIEQNLYIPYNQYEYNNSFPMYGYNLIYDSKCEQIILITDSITDKLKENGISENQIKIDTFYEESILNA